MPFDLLLGSGSFVYSDTVVESNSNVLGLSLWDWGLNLCLFWLGGPFLFISLLAVIFIYLTLENWRFLGRLLFVLLAIVQRIRGVLALEMMSLLWRKLSRYAIHCLVFVYNLGLLICSSYSSFRIAVSFKI